MIKTLAIDDEPLALQQLTAYIKKVDFLELAGECTSALQARDIMQKTTVDAIFIDINMPDLNGLDFVRQLDTPPLVVFTTAYSEYALEGYKVDAVDYLLKPYSLADFRKAATKVKKQYDLLHTASISVVDHDDSLFFKTEHRVVRVELKNIRYIEGMSEYIKIYLDYQKPLVVLLAMKKLEERLPPYFMRIHRSYIINLKKIQEVNKNRVIMQPNAMTTLNPMTPVAAHELEYLPIGDLYREAFNHYLNSKFLGK